MEIGEIAHHGPEDLFIAVMTLVGAFSFMMMINWKLALLTFFVIPFLLWLALYFNKKMTGTFRRLFSDVLISMHVLRTTLVVFALYKHSEMKSLRKNNLL